MRTEIFTLPTKTQIEMRQLLLADEDYMTSNASAKSANVNTIMTSVLDRCTVRVVDPGPYNFQADGKAKWAEMTHGDKMAALLMLRMLSYRNGNEMDIELRCPTCKKKFEWAVNLSEDVTWIDYPEESIEVIKEGKTFDVDVDGHKVHFTVATDKTEELKTVLSEQHPDNPMSCMIRSRIKSVEGIEGRDIMGWMNGNDKFPGLSSDDAEDMRDAFDAVEGGIDLGMEAKCPAIGCGVYFDFTLTFAGVLLPGKNIVKRRRAAQKAGKKMPVFQSSGD